MKRLFLSFVLVVCGLAAGTPALAESIRRFDVGAELRSDRTYVVTETIEYDFGGAQKHGIYRIIPVKYSRNGASYRLHLNVSASTMDGQPVEQQVTNEGSNIRIRLGSPDVYVTGVKTYVIRYSTDRAVNDFGEESEIYWNVTGDGWEVPIEASTFRLEGPAVAIKSICFTGVYGSTEQDCTMASSSRIFTAETTRSLFPREGFTVAVRYPASSIAPLPFWKILWQMVIDNIWLMTPVLVFILMYGYWRKHGKDPAGRGTVIAHYEEPRKLPPALLAGLLEQEISQKAITATILDLARRGYLKVVVDGDPASKGWFAKKATYHFHKLPASEDVKELQKLSPFELTILTGLFEGAEEVSLEDKKDGSFWKTIQTARHEAFDELKDKKLFHTNPAMVRGLWLGLAGAIAFASFFLMGFFGGLFIFAGLVSALIIAAFGWQMPKKTPEGAVVAEEAEGLRLFLSVTERDRLDFTDAPERSPEQFARFLPAAIAFGVEEKWAKQFAGIDVKPPSYIQSNMDGWSALQLVSMVDSMHSASTGMYHNPSSAGSGGSGFSGGGSGGGGGGGGGGSW